MKEKCFDVDAHFVQRKNGSNLKFIETVWKPDTGLKSDMYGGTFSMGILF